MGVALAQETAHMISRSQVSKVLKNVLEDFSYLLSLNKFKELMKQVLEENEQKLNLNVLTVERAVISKESAKPNAEG